MKNIYWITLLIITFKVNAQDNYSKLPKTHSNQTSKQQFLSNEKIAKKNIKLNKELKGFVGIFADVIMQGRNTDNYYDNLIESGNDYLDENAISYAKSKLNSFDFNKNKKSNLNNINDILNDDDLSKERYPVVGREIDKALSNEINLAYKEIKKLKENGLSHKEAINTLNEKHKKLEENTKQQSLDLKKVIIEKEKEHQIKLLKFQKEVATAQKNTFKELDKINYEILNTNERIDKNFEQIKENKHSIKNNRTNINENIIKINELQKLQKRNRNLINQNRLKIDVIGSVLYGQASTSDKIKLIKTGAVKVDNPDKTLKSLGKLESWENFNQNLQNGKEIVQLAKNLNIDPKIAKDANNILNGLGVISSFAMASTPMGWISAANGAFAMFGGGGGPDPAIQKIQQDIAEIKKSIEEINLNIEKLRKNQLKFHKENMRQFYLLHDKIDELTYNTEILWEGLKNQPDCNTISSKIFSEKRQKVIEIIKSINGNISEYNEILDDYSNLNLINCIKCINKNTENESNLMDSKFFLEKLKKHNLIFKPLTDYAKAKKFDIKNLDYSGAYFDSWNKINSNISYNQNTVLEFMIKPTQVRELIDLYLNFYHYNFLKKTGRRDNDYTVWNEEEFQKLDESRINARIFGQIGSFQIVKNWLDYTIIQQNLLSGYKLLNALSSDLSWDSSYDKLAFKAIQNNEILKLNLSNFIISKFILNNKLEALKFEQLYDKSYSIYELEKKEITELNKMLNSKWEFTQVKDKDDFYELLLFRKIEINGNEQMIYLPIDLEKSKTQEMIYPAVIDDLISLREAVDNHIIEFQNKLIYNQNK